MKKIIAMAVTAAVMVMATLSTAEVTPDDVLDELCSSVPPVPEKVGGLKKEGADAFAKANANLMTKKVVNTIITYLGGVLYKSTSFWILFIWFDF